MINFSKILVFTFLLISVLKFNAGAEVHPVVQKLIPGNLIDQNFNQVNSENLEGKIIGLYFSAGWCPPCRTFSPTLKEFREQNKEDFEVVMISADRNLDEQLQYMQSAKMTWPALPAGSYEANNLYSILKYGGYPPLLSFHQTVRLSPQMVETKSFRKKTLPSMNGKTLMLMRNSKKKTKTTPTQKIQQIKIKKMLTIKRR